MYRVDYLTASGVAPPSRLFRGLESCLPHIFGDGVEKAGRLGYHLMVDCCKPGVTALVQFKSSPSRDDPTPYVLEVSGPAAAAARSVLVEEDPDHQVARLDVCRDVIAPGLFGHYAELLQDFAERKRIEYRRLLHDPRNPSAGGTLYVGSPDSEARDVLYDKHAQDSSYEPGTVRFEHRLRPKCKARKRAVAMLLPEDAFRVGCIGAEIAGFLDGKDYPTATLPAPKEKTAADAIEYMLHSYRRKLADLAQQIGGTEAVLQFIRDRLPEVLESVSGFGSRPPQHDRSHAAPELVSAGDS